MTVLCCCFHLDQQCSFEVNLHFSPFFGLHCEMILGSDLDWISFGQNNLQDALQECPYCTPASSKPSVFEIKSES